tara:strand:- start:766 stop:1323 length:558 start_codon:yes stop_codon:yes gene_type:complete
MGTTTFNGPVRSENGFVQVTKAASTGIETTKYIGTKSDFTGLTAATVATGAAVSLGANTLNACNYTGAAAAAFNLPEATSGTTVVYCQSIDAAHATLATLTFNALGDNAWRTGSVIEGRTGGAVTFDTSTAGEGQLVFTPANATTNFFTIGSYVYFTCTEDGLWNIAADFSKDPLAVTGASVFAA